MWGTTLHNYIPADFGFGSTAFLISDPHIYYPSSCTHGPYVWSFVCTYRVETALHNPTAYFRNHEQFALGLLTLPV